ncbi:MAG: leucine-rich repeat domain-containing protein, partial [Clostridia bacterium]|nr:leucine-rich repeat domain-containing protein [Clostridia bacterium]
AVFSHCKELTSVTIPSSVTSIDSHAFSHCEKLESIIIPSSVTHISKNAFYGNENLTVYCEATSKPDGWDDEWTGDERKDIKVKEVIWGYKDNQ